MVEVNIKEEVEKAKKFKVYETYVFVQTYSNFYNGRICQVIESDPPTFIFLDDVVPAPFPIEFKELKYPIVPSNKEKK